MVFKPTYFRLIIRNIKFSFLLITLGWVTSCKQKITESLVSGSESTDILLEYLTRHQIESIKSAVKGPGDQWHLGANGIDLDKALLNYGEPKNPVVVAVIDSGIDIDHPDFNGRIWTNPDASDGKYAMTTSAKGTMDQSNGWSFFPDPARTYQYQGETKKFELKGRIDTLEITRLYAALPKNGPLTETQQIIKKDYELEVAEIDKVLNHIERTMNSDEVGEIEKNEFAKNVINRSLTISPVEGDLYSGKKLDFNSVNWGSRDVNPVEQAEFHGTAMSSLIAANRGNGAGINGISSTALIMPLAAVPTSGDERDENIYHAIRYAVDHGAKIINMSFGKKYSPFPEKIREALQYARKNDVLVVSSAGNKGENRETITQFPDRDEPFANWIIVGSYGRSVEKDSKLRISAFSNFGTKKVDILSPGENIVSLQPLNYEFNITSSGTSHATAITSGAAAFLLGHFPHLKAADLKRILLASTEKMEGTMSVPGVGQSKDKQLSTASQLVGTGGRLNLFNAMEMAAKIQKSP